jgi:DNA-directed RNA polymerase specialized sigma24 family protein
MTGDNSVSQWIQELKEGNQEVAQELWERYYPRLVALARRKLEQAPRRVADEEDAVVSAFDSFCRGAEAGRFPLLHDRNDLWSLLAVITARKAMNQAKYHRRQKRGGGNVAGESAFFIDGSEQGGAGIAQIVGSEPTPEFAATLVEQFAELLDRLGDSQLSQIAVRKMEGYSNSEIATEWGCANSTVVRKLRLIRKKLLGESLRDKR